MKDLIKITLNLAILFVVAGSILALVYAHSEPQIVRVVKMEKEKALKSLIPDASVINSAGAYEPIEGRTSHYYVARDRNGKTIGYIASSWSKGYSSFIHLFVAADPSMRIKAIKVLHEEETPGLGDDIGKQYFQDRFKGKTLDELVVVKAPDPTKILAVTGATISSKACTRGVRTGLEFLIKTYGPQSVAGGHNKDSLTEGSQKHK
ncbi:MAG: FMN-binding protein [Nitrospiraceae bacterium]|nr:FMN-binding protein [Nitrospiraceae bacterium]